MIRRRLVLAVSAVAALSVLVGGWLVLVVLEDRLVENLDQQFLDGPIADEIREAVGTARRRPMDRDRIDPVRDVAVLVYGAAGELDVAYPAGRLDDPAPLPDAGELAVGSGIRTVGTDGELRYRAVALRTADGGRIVVARSMATVDETLRDARLVLLAMGVAATAAIAALSWVAIRRTLAPIDGMIATADRIAAGALAERTEVADDGSEVGRLGSALDRMLDRIEEAVASKTASEERMRRFVADASHELRTPLTSVRGYAELYRQGARDDESVATSMDRIEAEATRMGRLVDDLLALARMDREPSARRELVDVGRVVAEAVDAARVVDGTRTWDLDVPAEPTATVLGDAAQLRQVADNLLANARLHTPEGTSVATSVAADGGMVRVEVRDDGPGIAPEDRARAFDRFWQATRADESTVQGTGLGLAIVRSIARAHGGDAHLADDVTQGTAVVVELPVAATAAQR
ncbi:MAG TPA: HAMP domain-containing sensor histidine kinase [Acidimicrobiales bacterium]|nr:HAMP domain-containing sensor histidine kinase [Acidimicrobiales bacterium]